MLHWIIKVRTTFVQPQSPFSPFNLIMREVSKYGDFSGPYFPVLVRIKENTDQKKTPYLDTFHAVYIVFSSLILNSKSQRLYIITLYSVSSTLNISSFSLKILIISLQTFNSSLQTTVLICDALRDLVSFVKFKKNTSNQLKPATLLKVTLLHGCFSCFLNCTNGIKSRNASNLKSYNKRHPGWGLILIC